jgi:hypothetical protein
MRERIAINNQQRSTGMVAYLFDAQDDPIVAEKRTEARGVRKA